ncbi:MAG TPA: OmpA family protein [Chitinophagaceae bacterium]|nr:OmpA family protein [Chitinophagaceae bacterium]
MKNKLRCLFLFALMCNTILLRAQNDTTAIEYKQVAADCDKAIPLRVYKRAAYGPTLAPQGPGALQEIVAQSKNSNTAFEKEHHSAWYLLTIMYNGELTFNITPQDTSNDYDFILYAYTGMDFCAQLQEGKARVVRSNIRRNEISKKGVTGLVMNAKNELQGQGPGAQFSKSLPVMEGERYMLVLDNVYDGGKGHTLSFHYMKEITVSGIVSDDRGGKVKADITLSDPKGKTVITVRSDDSGFYRFTTPVAEHTDYLLTFSEENSFFAMETINSVRDSNAFLEINAVLTRLVQGKKCVLDNIHFPTNSPVMYPSSYPSVEALCVLMKTHKEMVIRIEGHVNLPPQYDSTDSFGQRLSDERARAVYDYLVACGIEKERMSTIGHSNRFLLYRHAPNIEQQAKNRRVEINVISMGNSLDHTR